MQRLLDVPRLVRGVRLACEVADEPELVRRRLRPIVGLAPAFALVSRFEARALEVGHLVVEDPHELES